jgi:hypothetical protein
MLAGILALCAILLSPAGALGRLTLSATLLALWFYFYAAHSVPWFKNVYRGSAADLPCARHNRAPGGWVVRGCNCSSIGYAAAGDPTYRVVAHPNGNWGGCDRIVSVTPLAPEKLSPPNIGSPMYVRTMFRARYILCGL